MIPVRPRSLPLLAIAAALLAVTACSAGSTPSPEPSPSPETSPPPGGAVASPEEAAQLVLSRNPEFGELEPPNPDMIGQCCWYEARAVDGGYEVVVRIGWGDCPSGCIHERVWTYAVTPEGEVALISERGDDLEPGVLPEDV